MRPLRLSISGLRSYRKRVEIDFTDIGLMAIVGDTGAGKSSILEAITYALYNGTTWNQRDVRTLVADGTQTMSVEMDFLADGRTYRVMRSTSRSSYPPPVHRLECLSDTSNPTLDREDTVNTEVERLLGMDWKGFLAAVLLPQGRFQSLLIATPGDKAKILKGIFRLDEVEKVRDLATAAALEARPLLLERVRDRSQYRPNPLADAEVAGQTAATAEKEEESLRRVHADVKRHLDDARDAKEQGVHLNEPLVRLRRAPRGAAALLRGLEPIAEEIEHGQKKLAAELSRLGTREKALDDELNAAEDAGEGVSTIDEAMKTIEQVERTLKAVRDRRSDLEVEAKAIGVEEKSVKLLEDSLSDLEARDRAADEACHETEERHRLASDGWKDARQLLRDIRQVTVDLEAARKTIADRQHALETKRTSALKAADEEAERCTGAHDDLAHRLEHAVRANAVAEATQGLLEGDPCPVCAGPLPVGFVAPEAPDDGDLRKAVNQAATAMHAAATSVTRIQTEIAEEQRAIERETERLGPLAVALETNLGTLHATLPKLDLTRTDDQNLQSLVEQGNDLKAMLEAARKAANAANGALVAATTQTTTKRDEIGRRRTDLQRRVTANETDAERAYVELAQLPVNYRVAKAAKPAYLAGIKARLRTRQDELHAIVKRRDELGRGIRDADRRQRDLGLRRQAEVDLVRQRAMRELDALRPRINDCLHLAGLDAVHDIDDSATLAQLSVWASDLERRADEVGGRLEKTVAAFEQKANAEGAKAAQLLQRFEYRTLNDLEQAIIEVSARATAARTDEKAAREQITPAAALDRRIDQGTAFIEELEELARLLTEGQFIGHVIKRRQINLLAVASEILMSVTGNRYGFSADFQVVDQISGQPRPTRTLSGGESFLASLALALGLVEMAARAGGKLDALFLDEGFGALDSNSLDDALGALERRAAGGQLVAVVSHIKAVAERIETLLRVSRTPLGSEAVFVKGNERQGYVEDEVEAGLLT